jgi:hypothetical protein
MQPGPRKTGLTCKIGLTLLRIRRHHREAIEGIKDARAIR